MNHLTQAIGWFTKAFGIGDTLTKAPRKGEFLDRLLVSRTIIAWIIIIALAVFIVAGFVWLCWHFRDLGLQ